MVKAKIDMTGWKMWEHGVPDSRLIVLGQADDYVDKTGHRQTRYACKCSCGSEKILIVPPSGLRLGRSKSCGCLVREARQHARKHNEYDLSGEYGVGYCSNTGNPFYFDLQDYDKIKDYSWSEVVYGKSKYHEVRTTISTNPRKQIRLHQFLCGITCDHADRNPLNNRRNNLRPATVSENNRNRGLFQNNTSGIIGVSYESKVKGSNKWAARLYFEGKRYWLGRFKEKDDAIRARLQAEAKYYKEFAPQRHLFKDYNISEDELL